jgi:hypothetical protein
MIPEYEKILNDYLEGWLSAFELAEMCETDEELKKWVEHHMILKAALKELKQDGKIEGFSMPDKPYKAKKAFKSIKKAIRIKPIEPNLKLDGSI